MRKFIVPAISAMLFSAVGVVASAGPAMAEPCGTYSYASGRTLHVGYRNCGGSSTTRRATVGGSNYPCYIVRAGASQELANVPGGLGRSWSVSVC